MIKRVQDINELDCFKANDIYYIRIMSLIKAYGCSYDFAVFYKQINDSEEVTAIISQLDSDMTLCYSDTADLKELADFFNIIGFNSLLCDDNFLLDRKYSSGVVMSTDKKIELDIKYAEVDKYPKLMDIFSLDDYDSIQFESWYVDASHRIRHGCAAAYTVNVNNEIISSGMFSSIYQDNAILTSVKTSPEFRHLGYGSMLVSAMVCDIKKTVYLMRETNLNEEFYKKLGFENTGIWRMYK